ncbi:MAG: hypothetical protein OQJ96_04785 [Flavobacteriales bacterium]|nr:hypothetical protein [Flavobacteriales bacterium]MCW8913636.1 hypothetical protein [Flavobacteriales bacterium]MCW8937140.1 hypothetical protein [Flavobacteriales bacterium]MCW8941186.1 hypothetical protein [Flavobacteriales bacterium]MCW8991393.1 hypothetical protein [Flavobacteriales bacterium]
MRKATTQSKSLASPITQAYASLAKHLLFLLSVLFSINSYGQGSTSKNLSKKITTFRCVNPIHKNILCLSKIIIMKKSISLFLLLVSNFILFAQNENDTLTKKNLFVMNFQIGMESQKYDNLNKVFSDNGIATLSENSLSLGGGYYQLFGKSNIVNMYDFSVYQQSTSNQNNTTKLKGTGFDVMLGYAFVNESKIQLVAYGGLGYTWLNTKILTEIPNNTTVNGFLSGTANQYEMAADYFLANFGGQATFSPTIDKKTGDKLIIGIKTGYIIPVTETKWTTDNTNLKEGPKIDAGKFYLRFIIGITL